MATEAQILALGVQSGDIFAKASDTGNFYHIPAGGDGGDAVQIVDEAALAAETAAEAAEREALKKRLRAVSVRPVATRMVINTSTVNNTSFQAITSQIDHLITSDSSDYQLGYYNPAGGNSVTIKANLVVGAKLHKAYFAGQRTVIVPPGAIITSDPIGVFLTKGTAVATRTFADAGGGNIIKSNFANFNQGGLNFRWDGTDQVDVSSPPASSGRGGYGFSTSFILGKSQDNALCIIGDSITANGYTAGGRGWLQDFYGSYGTYGYNQGANANIVSIAEGGSKAEDYAGGKLFWSGFFKNSDVAVVLLGANNVVTETAAVIQAKLQTIYDHLASLGVKVYACTLTPRSTGTFATVEGQTPQYATTINALNAWIRTTPSPCIGYLDTSDAVSSARDSGKWQAGFTTDGLHPATAGLNALKTVIPADLLDF